MEHGYFHPERGYWQTTNEPPQHIIDGYPNGTVEVPLKPSGYHEWDGQAWVALVIDPAEGLAVERSTMECTPMQGILALGEAQWNTILNYRDTQATWAEKIIIDSAQTWVRNSQNISFFQYLLNLTDTQVDDLFRLAKTLDA